MQTQNETGETLHPLNKERRSFVERLNLKNKNRTKTTSNCTKNSVITLDKLLLIFIVFLLNLSNVLLFGINYFKDAKK